jgi:hypothetical protein
MKIICAVLLAVIFSFELHAQSFYNNPVKLNNTSTSKKEGFGDISLGFGIAKAFLIKHDELNRDHDTRFLVNLIMTKRIYHQLYLSLGVEYNKKDVDGYFDTYNLSLLPAFGGNVFNKKISYLAEAGPNAVVIFWGNSSLTIAFGLTLGLKAQYNITDKLAAGVDVRHINYFNVWSEHYFIVHSNIYLSMRI